MTTLADRIRGIVAPGATRRAGETGLPPLTPKLPVGVQSTTPIAHSLDELGGEWRDATFVVERRWDCAARHGREVIGDAAQRLSAASTHAPLLAGAAAAAPFIFVDLETTGLSGGAGTHAFLIGCGWFDADGGFVTRQFLMTRYAAERQLLETIASELARAGALVTFNGKSFDAPVLETRYAFHRMDWVGGRLPHIDVLHPARRFWGQPSRPACDVSSCTLQALERKVLGCGARIGDVPGFDVPARYFQYVRTGNPEPLAQVLEHNRLDLVTLGVLTSRLLHLARMGPEAATGAAEALGLGRLYLRGGCEPEARAAFLRAIALSRAPIGAYDPVRIDAVRALALTCRRRRQFDEAAAWWQMLMETRGCPPAIGREAAEALAIHHEHRIRNLPAARTFALRSLELEPNDGWKRAVDYRLARIDRKLNKTDISRLKTADAFSLEP